MGGATYYSNHMLTTRLVYCLVSASIAFSGPTFFVYSLKPAFLYLYFCVGHASRKIPRSWGWEERFGPALGRQWLSPLHNQEQLFGASGIYRDSDCDHCYQYGFRRSCCLNAGIGVGPGAVAADGAGYCQGGTS